MDRKLSLGLAAAFGFAALGSASAADFATLPLAGTEVAIHDRTGFDWDGFYAGVFGAAQTRENAPSQFGAGIELGVNAQLDFMLVGGEVALHGLTDGTVETAYGQVLGRTGLLITDDVLLYAAAGYGVELGLPADGDLLVGGGIELGLPGDVSVRAQYLRGFPVSGGETVDQVTLGARFHF